MTTLEDLKELKARKLETDIEKAELEVAWNRLQLEGANMKAADARASQDLNRIYHFFGEVDPRTATDCIEVTGQWGRRDPGKDITIVLNSPGGDITEGLAVYDHLMDLRSRGHKVTTIGRGMVASMGGVLLQAGTERVMNPNAVMLIHDGSYGVLGKGFEVKDRVKFIEMLQEKLYAILGERSSLDPLEIAARCDRKDWWMGATQALDLGFVDRLEA